MRSIGSPDFKYRPLSPERRKKMQDAALLRRGIPPGFCSVYGAIVPIEYRDTFRAIAAEELRMTKSKPAAKFAVYAALRALITELQKKR